MSFKYMYNQYSFEMQRRYIIFQLQYIVYFDTSISFNRSIYQIKIVTYYL